MVVVVCHYRIALNVHYFPDHFGSPNCRDTGFAVSRHPGTFTGFFDDLVKYPRQENGDRIQEDS